MNTKNTNRNTADFVLWMVFVLTIAFGLAFFLHNGTAGATSEGQYPNPYYIVCNDPLLTNVTLANTCNGTIAQPTKKNAAESSTEPPSTSVPPVVVVTETPVIIIDDGGETIPTETPSTPETPDTCNNGNPGNTKCVGNAGENPNGRGTMDNDNAGGNGNGEHGNQGEGGNNH